MLKDQIVQENVQSSNGVVNFEQLEASLNDHDIEQNFQLDQNLENG